MGLDQFVKQLQIETSIIFEIYFKTDCHGGVTLAIL